MSHLAPENNDQDEDWTQRFPEAFKNEPPSEMSSTSRSVNFEETLTVVKERVWSLGDAALKSVAEVLVGFGLSPTILGYTEEELFEDEDEELEVSRLPRRKDQVLSKSSFAMRSEENVNRRKGDDGSPFINDENEKEPYVQPFEEPSSTWHTDDPELIAVEDKKDK